MRSARSPRARVRWPRARSRPHPRINDLRMSSGSDRVLLLGDAMRSAAEVTSPVWKAFYDVDHAAADRVRAQLAAAAADHLDILAAARLLFGPVRRRRRAPSSASSSDPKLSPPNFDRAQLRPPYAPPAPAPADPKRQPLQPLQPAPSDRGQPQADDHTQDHPVPSSHPPPCRRPGHSGNYKVYFNASALLGRRACSDLYAVPWVAISAGRRAQEGRGVS